MNEPFVVDKNEQFNLAYRFVTETNENIFLTGKAGTGKTTFLKYLKQQTYKNMIVAAPTGVAAINAGGITLHSLFQLPFHPFLPTKNSRQELLDKLKFNRQKQLLLRRLELLVIDEISMVRCDTLDAIDAILKSVRRNYDAPFGGVQLLAIGDLYQLPPVAQRHEWEILRDYYASPFFFDSHAIKEQLPLLIELDQVYRQKDDAFVHLLNQIRNHQLDEEMFIQLNARYVSGFRPPQDENYITLTSHNRQADVINQMELAKLEDISKVYTAQIEGDFPPSSYPIDHELTLKPGAQVMFLKNDPLGGRFFNGKIGIVKALKEDHVIVSCDDFDIQVWPEIYENVRYVLNPSDEKLEQEVMGTFTQIPLRLAWAITIHKSQGLTFEKVIIDAGSAFSSGQVYVALSRATSLEGIVLSSKIPPQAIINNDTVRSAQDSLRVKGSLAERFKGARTIFTMQLIEEIFSFEEIHSAVTKLKSAILTHSEKLNLKSADWVADLFKNIEEEKKVGLNFIRQVGTILKPQPIIEQNEQLLIRLKAAALHFLPRLKKIQNEVHRHPLETEYRESATIINPYLIELNVNLLRSIYYLELLEESFSITSFLQHKMNWQVPNVVLNIYATGKNQDVQGEENGLFGELKKWRDDICNETNAPVYMVAAHHVLQAVADALPISKEHLLQIKGFGNAKVAKYGDDIIAIVRSYCERNQLTPSEFSKSNTGKKRSPKTKEKKPDTITITLNLFNDGKSMEEIAQQRSMVIATIESHIAQLVAINKINIDQVMTAAKRNLISEGINKSDSHELKKIKPLLPDHITYGEIKMVLAAERAAQEKAHEEN